MSTKPLEIEMPGPDLKPARTDYMPKPDLPGPEPDPDSNPPSSSEKQDEEIQEL